ncbi:MAG TPA: phosphoglycerate mutase (2,3-diphosphoglycerate-independent), partial [Mizugakiibacter sp.]|nr:phosphoglycerate mutase (2,3-diphosphoglycerate-independent) [Mizugakiibacter sp.]
MSRPQPVLLLILDGWGQRSERTANAVALARTPNWDRLLHTYPHTLINTHGLAVGLPEGQMGNSEVGHMNLGAGRIVDQELTRIDRAVANGDFQTNAALLQVCQAARKGSGRLHVMGLLSPGGVHSQEEHLFAMILLAHAQGVTDISVQAFLDGRDTPPQSAGPSLQRLQTLCDATPGARIASISGRYYAMDRDQRWERIEKAWMTIVETEGHQANDAAAALQQAYARGETDEFVSPTALYGDLPMQDGDAVVFMNFRADRARQFSRVLSDPDFNAWTPPRRPKLSAFVTLTEYATDLPVSAVAFVPQDLRQTLGEVLATHQLKQLRIAETEKYAHVTFFFSGGREVPFPGEERILVPSPQVATYDLQPEMSLPELSERLLEAIRGNFDFIVCNIANPDMVGHTGKLDAAIQAAEAVDYALGCLVESMRQQGGAMLITADHGNLEQMLDEAG